MLSIIFILPETKGISLERMHKIFGQVDAVEGGEAEVDKAVHAMEWRDCCSDWICGRGEGERCQAHRVQSNDSSFRMKPFNRPHRSAFRIDLSLPHCLILTRPDNAFLQSRQSTYNKADTAVRQRALHTTNTNQHYHQSFPPLSRRAFTAFHPSPMLPPGLQAGSAMPTEEPKQRFLETNYIIRKLASGVFGRVYISIPKSIADELISDTTLSPETLHSALRQNLQAAKISKSDGMAEEICLLKAVKVESSSSFTLPHLLASDPSPTLLWLTLPYLNGGTLYDLLQYYHQPSAPLLPTALVWHWISQMARTLLYLHSGLTITIDSHGKPQLHLDESWTPTIHADIHNQNLIFNTPSSSDSYPDLILSDFGNSIRQDSNQHGFSWTNLKEKQISSMLIELEQLANKVDEPDEWLVTLFDRCPSFGRDGDEDAENDAEREFLEKMINLAEMRKNESRKPMSEGLERYFGGQGIGNKELEKFIKGLRAEREQNLKQKSSAEASSSSKQEEKTPGCGCTAV
ncbi:hypothetical protein AC579_1410 [Pseudocercospora musae]|uniref:Protein kinase domain-containing protein n=1 Tax=Pseudocercospora musae TaxID=113226 RepID=A0A139IG66_9PEZI|nr:hypothetical protein AC579_1410 [Pseudocercospora musae]